jgi:signal transduction histidine kinase
VNQLLDLARAEAGHLEPEVAPFDVGLLAAELRGSLRPLVDERKVTLVTDVDAAVPLVESDRALVAQVLRNLLVNAIRVTEMGTIRLAAFRSQAAHV